MDFATFKKVATKFFKRCFMSVIMPEAKSMPKKLNEAELD
jgi:hypothetical protein